MQRRSFLTLLGGAAAAWPIAASAQRSTPVIGYIDTASASSTANFLAAFRNGLREVGYVDGQNVRVEYRWAEGNYERLPAIAAELADRRVAVLATVNTPSVLAAKAATRTIPIVFAVGVDPVDFGLVASLNRPGGNLTGVTQLSVEMDAKRLQLLYELVPTAKSIAFLVNPTSPAYSAAAAREAQFAARVLGIQLLILNAASASEIDQAFVALVQEQAGALLVSGDSFFVAQHDQLVALAARYGVPAMYHRREFTAAGGLMSYGPSLAEAYHDVGLYTGRILKGELPADLPVQQSVKFELAINLKIAKLLGLEVPTSVLLRADEVIE